MSDITISTPPTPTSNGPGAREASLRQEPRGWRRFFKLLGPGLISGAADDDPSSIGTCAQLGASLGLATLWTMLFTVPLMAAVQYLTAKIGLVTGRGLAGVIRQHFPRCILYPILLALVIANIINAGADLGGIAAAINLLCPQVSIGALIVPVATLILVLQVWGSYRLIERCFKWLTLAVLGYIGAAFLSHADLRAVLWSTFVPRWSLDAAYIQGLVAVVGTTFSPYLYFWQSSQEVEEKVAQGHKELWQRRGTTDAELKYAAWDVNTGMVLSNLVTYCVILTTAASLYQSGIHDVVTASQAARALRPIAGDAASILFALGLIGTGILTVPVLTTSAAYAVAEVFGWKRGLDIRPTRAPRFYVILVIATLGAMEINYLGINPMKALYWTSILYGFVSPPLLLIILLISRSRRIMGERRGGLGVSLLGWICVVVTFAAAGGLVVSWFRG